MEQHRNNDEDQTQRDSIFKGKLLSPEIATIPTVCFCRRDDITGNNTELHCV